MSHHMSRGIDNGGDWKRCASRLGLVDRIITEESVTGEGPSFPHSREERGKQSSNPTLYTIAFAPASLCLLAILR